MSKPIAVIKTKDLGCQTWNEAMAAVKNDKKWRLPTIDELEWMYENPDKIDKPFDDLTYWSSTEAPGEIGWRLHFGNGNRLSHNGYYTYRARVIRRNQFDGK